MTRQQFFDATRPKVQGSWYLHQHLPRDMDFFILLSSSVGIAGSRGQGNYSAGNTYEDALAHHRRGLGLPACSIDLGMVLGVGFLAEESTENRVHDNVKSWNFLGIREREFLGVMDACIRGESQPGVPVPPQLITGLGTGGMMAHGATKYPLVVQRCQVPPHRPRRYGSCCRGRWRKRPASGRSSFPGCELGGGGRRGFRRAGEQTGQVLDGSYW